MSRAELDTLAKEHENKSLFASKVITLAARQMSMAKARAGARKNPRRKSKGAPKMSKITRRRAAMLQAKHYGKRKIHRNAIQKKPVHRKKFCLYVQSGVFFPGVRTGWNRIGPELYSRENALAAARALAKRLKKPIKIEMIRGK